MATTGRPGPVLIDIPKDVQFASGLYSSKKGETGYSYRPQIKPDKKAILNVVKELKYAKKPILYVGGGVVNSGDKASSLLRQLASETNFPVTATLMGLGCYPASGKSWIGMLGMHWYN